MVNENSIPGDSIPEQGKESQRESDLLQMPWLEDSRMAETFDSAIENLVSKDMARSSAPTRHLRVHTMLINKHGLSARKLKIGQRMTDLGELAELLVDDDVRFIVSQFLSSSEGIRDVILAILPKNLTIRQGVTYIHLSNLLETFYNRLASVEVKGKRSKKVADYDRSQAAKVLTQLTLQAFGPLTLMEQHHPGLLMALPVLPFEARYDDLEKAVMKKEIEIALQRIDWDLSKKLGGAQVLTEYIPTELAKVFTRLADFLRQVDIAKKRLDTAIKLVRADILRSDTEPTPEDMGDNADLIALASDATFIDIALHSAPRNRAVLKATGYKEALAFVRSLVLDSDVISISLAEFADKCGHYRIIGDNKQIRGMVCYFNSDLQAHPHIHWAYKVTASGSIQNMTIPYVASEMFSGFAKTFYPFINVASTAENIRNLAELSSDIWDEPKLIRVGMSRRMVELYTLGLVGTVGINIADLKESDPRELPPDAPRTTYTYEVQRGNQNVRVGSEIYGAVITNSPAEALLLQADRTARSAWTIRETAIDIPDSTNIIADSFIWFENFSLLGEMETTVDTSLGRFRVTQTLAEALDLFQAEQYKLLYDVPIAVLSRTTWSLWLNLLKGAEDSSSVLAREEGEETEIPRNYNFTAVAQLMAAADAMWRAPLVDDLVTSVRRSIIAQEGQKLGYRNLSSFRQELRTNVLNRQLKVWAALELLRRLGYISKKQMTELLALLDRADYFRIGMLSHTI